MLPAILSTLAGEQLLQISVICSIVVLVMLYRWPGRRLSHIPAVGSSSPILSLIGAFEFLFNAQGIIQRGCQKYPNGIFRIPTLNQWVVLVNRTDFIHELSKATDDIVSFADAIEQTVQPDFTIGRNVFENPRHVSILRTTATKNLGLLFPALSEEISTAFNDLLPTNEDGWTRISAMKTMTQIICRASNRVFVGLPLCREPDFVDLNIQYTVTIAKASKILELTPPFLRPIVSACLTSLSSDVARGLKHLQPEIEERLNKMAEYGLDYPDKPVDFLTWLLEEVKGEETSIEYLTRMILMLNFAAIHTSSMTFCHSLFHLAARPEAVEVLRDEINLVVRREGWTYDAINKMVKVDSFIKESARFDTLSCMSVIRVVRQPFAFSDGTYLPPGTFVAAPAHGVHGNEVNYSDPSSFNPWRYLDRTNEDNTGRRTDLTSIYPDFLAFGLGKHACPGRFFAAMEIKFMLAYVVMNYDLKLDGPRPKNMWILTTCMPHPEAEVLFRKRSVD